MPPHDIQNHPRLSVAVIGASDRPDRYAYRAIRMLLEHGHNVYPVSPRHLELPGLTVYGAIADVPQPLHTVTLYVNPRILESIAEDIIEAKPSRVIFNPGTEHPEIADRFRSAGIQATEACTLVLLQTNLFTH